MTLVIGLILGLAAGAAAGALPAVSAKQDAEDETAHFRQLYDAQKERSREQAQKITDLNHTVREQDKRLANLDQLTQDAENLKGQLEDQAAALDQRESGLDQREQALDARAADIAAQQQTLESTTIPDGVWQLGRDYQAGTYRAPGGNSCYWEKLSAPTGKFGDLIANGGFGHTQTLTIDSPYFSTEDCGDWVLLSP